MAAKVQIIITGQNNASGAIKSVGNDLERLKGPSQIGIGALRAVGAAAVSMGIEAAKAVGGFVVDSIKTAGDFEQTMNVLGVTTGATADQMAQMSAKAIELGADL